MTEEIFEHETPVTDEAPAPKRRGRMPRKEEVRVERRRRKSGLLAGTVTPLDVDAEVKAANEGEYELRWINDTSGGRFHSLTVEDDWDPVTDKDGTIIKKRVGLQTDDKTPMDAVLCRKPKDWYREDQKEKNQLLDEQMTEIKRGSSSDGGSVQATGAAYVPKGSIKIEDGRTS